MRVVIQRVLEASVRIGGSEKAGIGPGLLLLVGVATGDTNEDAVWLCRKIARLRIFNDEAGLMNRSVTEIGGRLLVVSQFTLHASYKKGNRPSFLEAARPEIAEPLYLYFVDQLSVLTATKVETGTFGADMQVSLINDGPVTILMDTRHKE